MTAKPEPDRAALLEQIREARAEDLTAQEAASRLHQVVYDYLRELIAAEGNLVGPTVLREADWLYGQEGLSKAIARALGVSAGKLRWVLARERQIACVECSQLFTVREPRRKEGGYSPSGTTTCKPCRTARNRAEREKWHEREEARAAMQGWLVRVEQAIIEEVMAGRSPLSIEAFRRHLIDFAHQWNTEGGTRFTYNRGVGFGGGCMVCGEAPVDLFLMSLEQERKVPRQAAIRQMFGPPGDFWGRDFGETRLPVLSLFQSLWRISPAEYFCVVPLSPLLHMPLLLLCEQCADIVAAGYTKWPIEEPGRGASGAEKRAVVAEE